MGGGGRFGFWSWLFWGVCIVYEVKIFLFVESFRFCFRGGCGMLLRDDDILVVGG